jgi:hypothetical protein
MYGDVMIVSLDVKFTVTVDDFVILMMSDVLISDGDK